jgi:hypothetical protein
LAQDLDELSSAVATLQERLRRLEQRMGELEAHPSAAIAPAGEPAAELPLPRLPKGGLALAGRTLLVLAGGYLVRALTDAGVLPSLAGVGLGLAYAAFWQLRADRDGLAGARASALVHGLAASAIGFPLLWEATARFGLLGAGTAGAAVVGLAALGLLVALRHDLPAHAWLTTLAACATLLALLVSARHTVATLVALLGLAALVEWLAFRDAWLGLRWWAGAALDLVALLAISDFTRPEASGFRVPSAAAWAAAALLALPVLYVVSIAARTLRRGCGVRAFEVVQGTLAVALGLVGARSVLRVHGVATLLPEVLAVSLGAVCYAVAFAHAERRLGQGRNFYFYSTAGGLLVLGGTLELGPGSVLYLLWTLLGLVAVGFGRRFGRTTLRVHGAVYVAAAAAGSGLVVAGVGALAGLPVAEPERLSWGVAIGACAAWALLAGEQAPALQRLPAGLRLSRLILAVVVVLAAAGAAWLALCAVLPPARVADAGFRSVARSAVLAGLVLGLAGLARRSQAELAGLVWALVALGGANVLLRDFPGGRPSTLVASLALYGALLILVPRLLPARRPPADGPAARARRLLT